MKLLTLDITDLEHILNMAYKNRHSIIIQTEMSEQDYIWNNIVLGNIIIADNCISIVDDNSSYMQKIYLKEDYTIQFNEIENEYILKNGTCTYYFAIC